MIFERDVEIPTREGGALRANVYRPVGDGPYPVILTHGPYGKDRHWADRDQQHARDLGGGPFVNWETPDPETWVPKGYAVVRVDGRGTGASPGELQPFSDRAARDYYDAIEWAGVQPWSTGKVGLLGISFYAMAQWPVAALRPPHLAAMVPWEAAADMYRDFMRAGGIANDRFLSWWWPNTVLNVQHGWDGSLTEEERAANTIASLTDAVARPHPLIAGRLHTALGETDLANIEVPFLSVGNWGNIGLHLRGNIEAFLQANSQDKWLRIIVGDHIHPFYEPDNVALQERFLNHYLKGEDNGWQHEPKIMLAIREGDKVTWRGEQSWPIERTQWTDMHLEMGKRALSDRAPNTDEQISYSTIDDSVTLTTAAFAAEVEVTGPLALRLWVSSTTADTDIFVRLGRVEPDGQEVLGHGPANNQVSLTQGYLRASHRKLDAARSLPYRPFHTHDEAQPLEPGKPVALDIEIWPTSMVFPAGGRLILEIGGRELSYSHFVRDDEADRPAEIFDSTVTLYSGCTPVRPLVPPVLPASPGRPRDRRMSAPTSEEFRGKVVMVTGAARGIGRASALAFARRGASVIVCDVLEDAHETVELIESLGSSAIFVHTDVSNADAVQQAVGRGVAHFGRLDFAHNNAGIGPAAPVADIDEADWDRTIGINLTGVFLCMKYQLPHVLQQRGAIVNTASMWAP